MERTDEKFNRWIDACEQLKEFNPFVVIDYNEFRKWATFTSHEYVLKEGEEPEVEDEKTSEMIAVFGRLDVPAQNIEKYTIKTYDLLPEMSHHIKEKQVKLERLMDNYTITDAVFEELELNVSKIYTDEGVTRYLSYLKKRTDSLQHRIKYYLSGEDLEKFFNDWYNAHYDPFATLPYKNEIYDYLKCCETILAMFRAFQEYLNYLIKPNTPDVIQQDKLTDKSITLTADTHKLLLLHKLGLFEPSFKAHYNSKVPGMFTSLVSNLLGVSSIQNFRPQLTKFINGSTIRIQVPNIKLLSRQQPREKLTPT